MAGRLLGEAEALRRQTAAGARRGARAEARITWFRERLEKGLKVSLRQRVKVAVQFLEDRIRQNVSRPVTKTKRQRGKATGNPPVKAGSRSKPGEFPKAETTQLMKTLFHDVSAANAPGGPVGFVGTPLDYGLILETKMKRSFLRRTLNEEMTKVRTILTAGLPGWQ